MGDKIFEYGSSAQLKDGAESLEKKSQGKKDFVGEKVSPVLFLGGIFLGVAVLIIIVFMVSFAMRSSLGGGNPWVGSYGSEDVIVSDKPVSEEFYCTSNQDCINEYGRRYYFCGQDNKCYVGSGTIVHSSGSGSSSNTEEDIGFFGMFSPSLSPSGGEDIYYNNGYVGIGTENPDSLLEVGSLSSYYVEQASSSSFNVPFNEVIDDDDLGTGIEFFNVGGEAYLNYSIDSDYSGSASFSFSKEGGSREFEQSFNYLPLFSECIEDKSVIQMRLRYEHPTGDNGRVYFDCMGSSEWLELTKEGRVFTAVSGEGNQYFLNETRMRFYPNYFVTGNNDFVVNGLGVGVGLNPSVEGLEIEGSLKADKLEGSIGLTDERFFNPNPSNWMNEIVFDIKSTGVISIPYDSNVWSTLMTLAPWYYSESGGHILFNQIGFSDKGIYYRRSDGSGDSWLEWNAIAVNDMNNNFTFGANLSVSGLSGTGNAYVCVNSAGTLYRSSSECI